MLVRQKKLHKKTFSVVKFIYFGLTEFKMSKNNKLKGGKKSYTMSIGQ